MTKKLTPGQITLLVALAVLFVVVAVGVNRSMHHRSQLQRQNDCVSHALATNQPLSVCGNTP